MKEVYRIKKGQLTSKNFEVPFDFGLIFEDEDFFLFDFYISESYDLKSLMEKADRVFLQQYFLMTAYTEDNNKIEATYLSARSVTPHKSKISMQCYGHISHSDIRANFKEEIEKESEEDKRQTLFYIELEGLKMKFSDLTETIRARRGVKIKDFNDWEIDHTSATLIYDGISNSPYNNFNLTFFKNEKNDNIIVAFPNYRDNRPNILYYDIFKEFKRDFISLMSLLNGAEVKVKKEFIGGFFNIGIVNSQTVITYSYKTIKNERHSDYVPLNNGFHRGSNILNHIFINCFNKYVAENKKLDLNSIIFYLNGAEQSTRIEEKFFVQIIAFERLAQKYVETLDESDTFLVPDKDFQSIKKDLLKVLNTYSKIIGNKLNRLSSKVGEIHKVKRTSTEYKFIKLLEYANIQINQDIQNIIDEVRHKSIHHGEIGGGNQGVKNSLVLDQLLRDIILNIIGYNQARISLLN